MRGRVGGGETREEGWGKSGVVGGRKNEEGFMGSRETKLTGLGHVEVEGRLQV